MDFLITGSRDHYMCDTEVDLCYSYPCMNNGTCVRREGGYTCVCSAGYTGMMLLWYAWSFLIHLYHFIGVLATDHNRLIIDVHL